MNDFCAPLFEGFFDYDYCSTLLDALNNGGEYTKITFGTIGISLIGTLIFYKLINPARKQRLKWLILVGVIAVLAYGLTTLLVNSNIDVMEYLANYDPDSTEINGGSFKFKISLINSFYSIVLTVILSTGIKYTSKVNKHNPF